MKIKLILPFQFFLFVIFIFPQQIKILESNDKFIKLEFNFDGEFQIRDTLYDGKIFQYISSKKEFYRNPGEPWLPVTNLSLGIPFNSTPSIRILTNEQSTISNKFIIPFPAEDPLFEKSDFDEMDYKIYGSNKYFPENKVSFDSDYIMRYARVIPLNVSPYQFNPVTRELNYSKRIVIQIDYNEKILSDFFPIKDGFTDDYLKTSVINFSQAVQWTGKKISILPNNPLDNYWYDPAKDFFKIYLKVKGVYRLTYDYLSSKGMPLYLGMPSSNFNIYNNGVTIPIDVVDGGDSTFDHGDYIEFVGYPPTPTPYSNMNIYNLSNIYWISYQENTTPHRYTNTNGFPSTYSRTFTSEPEVLHFEKDSLYERLGYVPIDMSAMTDYWFWGKATAQNRQALFGFEDLFSEFPNRNLDSNWVTLRVKMHGMTNSSACATDHKAEIELTDQPIGSIIWDGQKEATFEKRFYVSNDSIRIFPTGNRLNVWVRGDICPVTSGVNSDEIRVNWYEFEYERTNRVNGTYFIFKSPKNVTGVNRYWLWSWESDSMKILIPSKSKMIKNPQKFNDDINSFLFVDTVNTQAEYFCVSDNSYLLPDSVVRNIPSDLRNTSNGADYIIITHPDFIEAANRLAEFRINNFSDSSIANPRVKVVDVRDIYKEFSYGLLDPYAIKYFVQYAFENWESPAPSYIALMGDMSYDYRHLVSTDHYNYIPAIPYFATGYGQAASDNNFVAVTGIDLSPDLAIGRISCETLDEANILVDKIINYPGDNSKDWKQNVLLLSSGLSLEDENSFGFNDANILLQNAYVYPEGINTTKIFRYPNKPEYIPYQGEGPQMREGFNEGAVIANYYGHGGGYQWDLVFLNDDIYLLENGNRMPFISSVTCYTAHFDNQDVFGEQFNKIPGKGSIGFWGSSGLTYWGVGKDINQHFFNEVFKLRNHIVGKAILHAKNQVGNSGIYGLQLALLTLLGDPMLTLAIPNEPDFVINSSGITITPSNPLVEDTVKVKALVQNKGIVFSGDSVLVELFATSVDTSYMVGSTKLSSFGELDSAFFDWTPTMSGLFELKIEVNSDSHLFEEDHSDNTASSYFAVFDLGEPNIIYPLDGTSSSKNTVDFLLSDIGYYLQMPLTYYFEIDTSLSFTSPIIQSIGIQPQDAILKWTSPSLSTGSYFWRTRIFNGAEFGSWSDIRSFTIGGIDKNGYYAEDRILKSFQTYNINYSDSSNSLILNTELLPPKPDNKRFVEDIIPQTSVTDSVDLTTITTDGTYIYFGNISFFAYDPNKNPNGYSHIYKVGTGNNGTVKGAYYGAIPQFYDKIYNSIIAYSDGYVYVCVGDAHHLVKINPLTGDTSNVFIPDGILGWDTGQVIDGPAYFSTDGRYLYNLSLRDSVGNHKYVIRTIDPQNGWQKASPDVVTDGSIYEEGFSGFFTAMGFFYPSEYFFHNEIRRIRISDGFFEQEWRSYEPFQSYYAWTYDWVHDEVYASVYRESGYPPKFSKFRGSYTDAEGTIYTEEVGNDVLKWNSVSYEVQSEGSSGIYKADLEGLNKADNIWQTAYPEIKSPFDLSGLDLSQYSKLRLFVTFSDSSFGGSQPLQLKNVHFDYVEKPEVVLISDNLKFNPDSLMQGFEINMDFKVSNVSHTSVDSVTLQFFLNSSDTPFFTPTVNLVGDSSSSVSYVIPTSALLFDNPVLVFATAPTQEFFTYNNITNRSFYVSRDSLKPNFNITFDGKDIIDGDIISAKPEVVITLEDNSPLPLDTTFFTIVHNNVPLNFSDPKIHFDYTPYPNSKATITWTPILDDGRHSLEVLAKDASNNFFDSTSYRTNFSVFNDPNVVDVYNYPNPFEDETYFTFNLHGSEIPESMTIKVYTVAGRLIRNFLITSAQIVPGFNQIKWDGRDEDGDLIANGLYFYKLITKIAGESKTITQKLVKMK